MVFSATCPTIPLEQVHAEVKALSKGEFRQLQDDLYGRSSPFKSPPRLEAVVTSNKPSHALLYEAIRQHGVVGKASPYASTGVSSIISTTEK